MKSYFKATVQRTVRHTADLATLDFLVDGALLQHKAGQYITVFFDDTNTPEGKAYSLSSAPSDPYSSITVKKVGEFSGRLYSMDPGDEMVISMPYGSFNAYEDDTPLVCIAGGTGAAPIHSVIRDECLRKTGRAIQFLWSNKTLDAAVWDFSQAPYAGGVEVAHFITQQAHTGRTERRICADDIAPFAMTHCFYVCGTVEFVRSMWRMLTGCGVPDYMISTETFFGEHV